MRGKTPDWTQKEDRLLKDYYGTMKLRELRHIFPDRTENAIRGRLKDCEKRGGVSTLLGDDNEKCIRVYW